jgi:hypothetical protein
MIIAAGLKAIAASEPQGRTPCLVTERNQLMLEIAAVPVETAAGSGSGSDSGLVKEEVEVVVQLVLENLEVACWEVEVA